MKKLVIIILTTLSCVTTAHTAPLTEWPRVPYPTELIGRFMNFCQNALNTRAAGEQGFNPMYTPPHVNAVNVQVCACIIDSFRKKNSEAVFRQEFTASTAEEVPYFSKYLGECSEINNNLSILKHGS